MIAGTTNPPSTSPKSDHDSPWKEALEHFFPEFLALLFPAIHAEIDWSVPLVFLDKELQKISVESPCGRRYADKLVRVQARDGVKIWVLIHTEVQGEPESGFPERMYTYQYRLRDRYGIDVVSLAVLADTRASFRPSRFQYVRWGCTLAFSYPVAKLTDWEARWEQLEASENVFALVVIAQLHAKRLRPGMALKDAKVALIRRMYERGYSREQIQRLFRLIDWIITLPQALEPAFTKDVEAIEEATKMPYMNTFERIGFRQGEATILLALLDEKFGPDTVDAYRERITTAEPEQLLQWSKRILSAETPETIFH